VIHLVSRRMLLVVGLAVAFLTGSAFAQQSADPLASWNDGATKSAIIDFVTRVTTQDGADFVPPAERIAAFDNDGTLWAEQPIYFQLAFALDRVRALSEEHPEWRTQQPFKFVLENDQAALAASGEKGLREIMAVTHAGINRFIGRRPILTFGNSDGDLEMPQWTAAGSGARFLGLVHHTDAAREYAYDRQSHVGKLDKALDEATARGWTVVDMKADWRAIFPPDDMPVAGR
jgi:hypothetical protein